MTVSGPSAATSSVFHQYWASICANLTHVSLGASVGWLLLTSTGLQTHDRSHLGVDPIGHVELTWVIGALLLSAVVGTLFISWMADGFGRKHTLCTLSLAQMGSWGLYMIATNATEMYIAGILAGFAGGGSLVIVLLFIAEIAEDRVRGVLVASTTLLLHVGQLLAIVPLCFLSAKEVTFGLCLLPVAFVLAFVYYPDTPFQLRKENQKVLAIKSLHLYRGARLPVHQYTDYIKKEVIRFNQTTVDVKLHCDNFTTRSARKAFVIFIVLTLVQQCCVCCMSLAYTNRLPFDHRWMALLCGALQVLGALLACCMVERIGRKILLLVSTVSTALAFAALAICLHIEYQSSAVLTGLIGAIAFGSSVGLLPMAFVVLVDVMPQQIRTMGISVCLSLTWLLWFGLHLLSYSVVFELHIFAYVTAALCMVAAAVATLLLPEPKGLSNAEIVHEMERR